MLLLGMAKVLGSMGRASEAMETYQRVITLLESSRGGENEELAVPLLALGNLLMKEGRAPDAESPFDRLILFILYSIWLLWILCLLIITFYILTFCLHYPES